MFDVQSALKEVEQDQRRLAEELQHLQETHAALTKLRDRFSAGEGPAVDFRLEEGRAPSSPVWAHVGIADGTKLLINEKGPLDTAVIAAELLARGIKTKSQKFVPNVYTVLRESPRFVRLKDVQKWDLAENHPTLLAEKRAALKAKGAAHKAPAVVAAPPAAVHGNGKANGKATMAPRLVRKKRGAKKGGTK